MSNREILDRLSDLFGWEEHDRLPVGLVVERVLGLECEDCGGTGMTKQGWTDKDGFSEDQYGPCWSCARGGQR